MPLNLEKQLTLYGAYHRHHVNINLHRCCVPLMLVTSFILASNIGPFFELPQWLSIPHLEPNMGTFAAFTWGALYILLEPVAGTTLAALCIASAAFGNHLLMEYPAATNRVALSVHIISWILQFVGHGKYRGRIPVLENFFQSLFFAPLFVWLELLFKLGYRPELQARVRKTIEIEISKMSKKEPKDGKIQ
ncbi:hypothetical protein VTK73DRAFT_9472 [Phialemonium thermophilum]|uniref:DUF962 domain-containing protein n=1 Tax=Phialemonium thermophilum TaxID=223376 RepID=A0ABR3Y469_9PEZI